MKTYAFHLMTYPDLPDDFKEKYHSVYIDIPSALYDPVRGHEIYNNYMDQLEYAAEVGFDGVCVNEHHQNAYGLMASPNLIAAALARRTKDAAIVVLGNSIVLYNPPTRVAEEFAMLDVISGGRLIAGFPLGTSMDTNYAFGQTPATLRDKYHEAHDLIIKAWTEPEPFAWNGRYTQQLRYVNVWPRPVQKPHPPVWIPGGSSPETAEWVVEKDYLYAHLSMSGHKRAKVVIDDFHALAERNGREYNPYRVGMTQYVFVADNDEQAEELYSEHASYFFQKSLHIYRGFTDAPGYRSPRSIESGLAAQGFGRSSLAPPNAGWKQYLEQGSIIAGSPKSVTEQLRETAKKMRVGHLMILIHIGSLGHEATMRNVKLLGEQVLPNLRDIWPEYEDHWGIHPLKQRVAAATAN